MVHRQGSDSRCCRPQNAPYIWHCFYRYDNKSVQEVQEWLDSLSVFAAIHEQGRITTLFEIAAQGKLWDTGDYLTQIKPVRSDPEIFELRHTALNRALRFYHAEPSAYPKYLIALHKHMKTGSVTQQEEIDFAVQNYRHTD